MSASFFERDTLGPDQPKYSVLKMHILRYKSQRHKNTEGGDLLKYERSPLFLMKPVHGHRDTWNKNNSRHDMELIELHF